MKNPYPTLDRRRVKQVKCDLCGGIVENTHDARFKHMLSKHGSFREKPYKALLDATRMAGLGRNKAKTRFKIVEENPGAAWHRNQRDIEANAARATGLPKVKEYFYGRSHAHGESLVESDKRGIKNPHKRRKSGKKRVGPLLIIGGVLVTLFLLTEV